MLGGWDGLARAIRYKAEGIWAKVVCSANARSMRVSARRAREADSLTLDAAFTLTGTSPVEMAAAGSPRFCLPGASQSIDRTTVCPPHPDF